MSASFDAYKIFYYVGKYKNITHAASALFLSQSTVSRGIQSLESELGCQLFERTQHGVAFTEAGRVLYEHIAIACESIFRGEEKLSLLQKYASGHLRLGANDFTFSQFVLPSIAAFHRDHSEVKIDVFSKGFNSAGAVMEALLSRNIDLACATAAAAEKLPPGQIDITPVCAFEDIVVASSDFHELRNGKYTLPELAAYPYACLAVDLYPMPQDTYLEKVFQDQGISVQPVFTTDSVPMFLSIIAQCPCLALVPTLLWDQLAGTGVFAVAMAEPLPLHTVNIYSEKNAPQNALRDAFSRQLKRQIRAYVQGKPWVSPETG